MAIILSPDPLMDDNSEISPYADGGDHLTGENAAANMAHEAFGHAYMYELNGGDTNNASHHYEVNVDNSYVGADGSWNMIYIDTNIELQQHINEAVNEAKNNYDCGL